MNLHNYVARLGDLDRYRSPALDDLYERFPELEAELAELLLSEQRDAELIRRDGGAR